jgi:hypothetical protein
VVDGDDLKEFKMVREALEKEGGPVVKTAATRVRAKKVVKK